MKKSYYTVKKGRKTGVYRTWAECKAQVDGFSGAVYKGFSNRPDAEKYLAGPLPIWVKSKPKSGEKKPFKWGHGKPRHTKSIMRELYDGSIPPWDESLGLFQCLNEEDQVLMYVWNALHGIVAVNENRQTR